MPDGNWFDILGSLLTASDAAGGDGSGPVDALLGGASEGYGEQPGQTPLNRQTLQGTQEFGEQPGQTPLSRQTLQGPSGAADYSAAPARPQAGLLDGIANRLGLKKNAAGQVDYSNPATIDSLMKAVLGVGSVISALNRSKTTPQNSQSASQLQAQLANPLSKWTPLQQSSANTMFGSPMPQLTQRPAGSMASTIVPGRGYAMGGSVGDPGYAPQPPGTPTSGGPQIQQWMGDPGNVQDGTMSAQPWTDTSASQPPAMPQSGQPPTQRPSLWDAPPPGQSGVLPQPQAMQPPMQAQPYNPGPAWARPSFGMPTQSQGSPAWLSQGAAGPFGRMFGNGATPWMTGSGARAHTMPSMAQPWAGALTQVASGLSHRPRGYAHGGAVPDEGGSGPVGYIQTNTGGQDDVVPINAAGGEYMFDADSVAALGDGNNAAGAKILDDLRQELRKHKRSAPPDKIPPRAKPLAHYMKKG